MSDGWSLTESDPAIFSLLLSELGVSGLQVEELWSLEKDGLERLEPVYALIFLFKYLESHQGDPSKQAGEQQQPPPGTWFAHQVITNACATLAILNAVMNIPTSSANIELGHELDQLKAFSVDLDPRITGELLTNSEKIRSVHNSFARPDPFHRDEPKQVSSEDAYHFITYMPIGGKLYELDGLKELPVCHGQIPGGENWTNLAREVIGSRIQTYSGGEVHFNLMAICGDRLKVLEERRSRLSEGSLGMERLRLEIEEEEAKRKRWSEEVAIRRHNHIGLVHALMMGLAKSGKLAERVEIAKKKMVERRNQSGGNGMELDD